MSVVHAARAFRARLTAQDDQALAEIRDHYTMVIRAVDQRLRAVTSQLALLPPGEPAPISWLYERDRLTSFRAQVEREVRAHLPAIQAVAVAHQQAAATLAHTDALTLVNQSAGTRLAHQRLDTVRAVQATGQARAEATRDLFRDLPLHAGRVAARALETGITLGQSPTVIARDMTRALGGNRARAQTIARTEALRAYRESSMETWRRDGDVSRWQWFSTLDRTACPVCWAMHGTLHPITETMGSHPACFPAGTLVGGPPPEAATVRDYTGELVTIRTAAGHLLTGTPNHPVATRRGWVPLNLIQPGDEVIGDRLVKVPPENPHGEDRQPRIEQVAEALRRAGDVTSIRVPGAPEQFHGDGTNSEVDVVAANRLLRETRDAAVIQPPGEHPLVHRDTALALLAGPGALLAGLVGLGVGDATRPVRVEGGEYPAACLCTHLIGAEPVLQVPAALHASLSDAACDEWPGYAEATRDGHLGLASLVRGHECLDVDRDASLDVRSGGRLGPRPDHPTLVKHSGESWLGEPREGGDYPVDGFPGDIALHRVVEVSRRYARCHVYNLQTRDGWYTANGIVVHNCRCTPLPVPNGTPPPIPETESGEARFERLTYSEQRDLIGPRKHDAYLDGQLRLPDLVATENHPRWGLVRRERSLRDAMTNAPSGGHGAPPPPRHLTAFNTSPSLEEAYPGLYRRSMDALETAHITTPPGFRPLGITATNITSRGLYHLDPRGIEVSRLGAGAGAPMDPRQVVTTIHHEIGHAIDHHATGALRLATDQRHHVAPLHWRVFLNVARDTDTVRGIHAARDRYLLRPWEVWARAFQQYVAEQSDPDQFGAIIRGEIAEDGAVLRMWGRDDWPRVRRAVQAVLRREGWIP